ncbi:DUF2069 domain-containing protein [Gallaecimonas kandeliae]|uniref:DUF2069 domain-containing protein n=1 Tax=Gallaecimonas kandeliae TaxID=3029055 RepID=UPI00264892C1|nr:DUF2069 domain-containing protein [Gallaecimonas kandeliae]WKE66880.1 DUF2069 domain-containing protein [Gallaecimonas kandeliae]
MKAEASRTRLMRHLALAGYLGLLLYVPLWQLWLAPHPGLSTGFVLAFGLGPLLLPLKGMLKGNPYTYAWANFILMLYLAHGLTLLWTNPEERLLAAMELLLVALMFIGSVFYARWRGKELDLGLKRTQPR